MFNIKDKIIILVKIYIHLHDNLIQYFMNSDLTPNTNTNSGALRNSNVDFEAFKSFYYLLKGKRDTDIKLYDNDKCFCFDDFKELNSKVYRKLENHQLNTDMVHITIGLDNKEVKSFGSWIEFVNYDWQISNRVKYFVIDWIFQIFLPDKPIPQEHSVRIKIGNSLNPNEFINVLLVNGGDIDIEEVNSQMSCKIDFVNPQICSELFGIVTEWYNALPNNGNKGKQKFYKLVVKYEDYIYSLIRISCFMAGVICANALYKLFEGYLSHGNIVEQNVRSLSYASLIVFIFFLFGKYLSHRTYKGIAKLLREPVIKITKGDINACNANIEANNKIIRQVVINIIAALAVNGIGLLAKIFTN